MKKSTRLILIIFYSVTTIVVAVVAGLTAGLACGIERTPDCYGVKAWLPSVITASIILAAGGTFIAFQIKKYKKTPSGVK